MQRPVYCCTFTVKLEVPWKCYRGQEFDVEGEEGKIYNLITDRNVSDSDRPNMVLNVVLSQAYTTGVSMGTAMDVKMYHPSGTWISQIGLMVSRK